MSEGRSARVTYFDGQAVSEGNSYMDSSGGADTITTNNVTVHCFGE